MERCEDKLCNVDLGDMPRVVDVRSKQIHWRQQWNAVDDGDDARGNTARHKSQPGEGDSLRLQGVGNSQQGGSKQKENLHTFRC